MKRLTIRMLSLVCLAALVPACGGGGDDGPAVPSTQNGLLSGVYHYVSFGGNSAPAHDDASRSGTATFDGLGGVSLSWTENSDGTIGSLAQNWTYSIAADGTLTATTPGGTVLAGHVQSNGDVALAARISAGAFPMQAVFVRKGGATFGTADLTGDYWTGSFSCDPAGPTHASRTGTVTFDGAGASTSSLAEDAEGVITATTPTGTYAVAADGTLTYVSGGETFTGGLLAGAGVAVAASTSGGSRPQVMVFLRKSGAFTTASFTGPHALCGFEFDLTVPTTHQSSSGTVTPSGMGAAPFSLTVDAEGTIVPVSGSSVYTVTPDGTLTVTLGVDTLRGGLPPGAGLTFLAPVSSGSDPRLHLLLKK